MEHTNNSVKKLEDLLAERGLRFKDLTKAMINGVESSEGEKTFFYDRRIEQSAKTIVSYNGEKYSTAYTEFMSCTLPNVFARYPELADKLYSTVQGKYKEFEKIQEAQKKDTGLIEKLLKYGILKIEKQEEDKQVLLLMMLDILADTDMKRAWILCNKGACVGSMF
jgi:hypothetical protein